MAPTIGAAVSQSPLVTTIDETWPNGRMWTLLWTIPAKIFEHPGACEERRADRDHLDEIAHGALLLVAMAPPGASPPRTTVSAITYL